MSVIICLILMVIIAVLVLVLLIGRCRLGSGMPRRRLNFPVSRCCARH